MADPAVGEFTVETSQVVGNHWICRGLLTADSTARAFQILPTTAFILWANIWNKSDDDATYRVVTNSDDGTENSDNGSLYVQTSSSDDDVFRYEVAFAG